MVPALALASLHAVPGVLLVLLSAPAAEEHEEQHQSPGVERPSILAMAFVWLMHGLLPRRAWHFNRYRRHRRARR